MCKSWARGEGDALPAWDSYFEYAEKFGLDPETIPQTVKQRTWLRWLLREKTYAARRAHNRADQSENWVKELSSDELELIEWASDKNNANTD